MATNLRLHTETEAALQAEAERSGRSQQAIIREAINRHLRLNVPAPWPPNHVDVFDASGEICPPRTPYRKVAPHIQLSQGETSLDMLNRADRF